MGILCVPRSRNAHMEARNRTLPDWLTRIRTHQIALPRFQRYEAWSHSQVTGLLDNVVQELPVGAVLILEVGEREPFHSRPVVGAPTEGERVTEHLLDGQQRLTALWRSLNDGYDERSYFVVLEEDEETRSPYFVKSYSRWRRATNAQRYPLWLNEPQDVWENNMIPIPLLRPGQDAEYELDCWAEQAARGDRNTERTIIRAGNRLRHLFDKFNIPFLSLPSSTPNETALNVFIQMNTSASPLTAHDIVVAQVEAAAETSLHELTNELKQSVPAIEAYVDPADLALAVSALLQDKPPSKSTYLSAGFSDKFVDLWDRVVVGVRRAIAFLEEERLFDGRRLPTEVALYPLVALWSQVSDGLDAEGEARHILRKYLWRAFCTDRYERTSASRALTDFRQLSKLLRGERDQTPEIFSDRSHPLPTLEELTVAGWPYRKDRLARAILAVSLRARGCDFADGGLISRNGLRRREYHHLFPRAWLQRQGYSEEAISRSLNCALVSWRTNRTISDKPPSTYLDDRMEATSLGEVEIERRLKSHLIPYAAIRSEQYEAFLEARAQLVLADMKELCAGQSR
ncbi:MAG: DUF262 domain-containing protein [Cyanobacteria bacterium J06639_1]